MAYTVTPTLKKLARQRVKTPQIIMEIEGIPFLFGANPVETLWTFDEDPTRYFDDLGLRFDTPIAAFNSMDVISLQGTTKTMSQQVVPDKSGTSSISTLKIDLVDKDKKVTEVLNFENYVEDILGKKATVYLSLVGASHPEDSIAILQGYIDDYSIVQGSFLVSVSHPENLKRKEVYDEYTDKTDETVTDTQTTIAVVNTDPFLLSSNAMTSYVTIDDEKMRVTSKTSSSVTVVRAQLGTVAVPHDFDADVENLYVLEGNPIDLALKLYLSDGEGSSFGEYEVESFNLVGVTPVSNSIFFKGYSIEQQSGVVVGDSIIITSSASNNGTYTVVSINLDDLGSYITVSGSLTLEEESNGVAALKSKYNVLPFGLGLTNREVDVLGHEEVRDLNTTSFSDMKFYLTEQVEGKDFIDKEIYFPQSLYSVPRQARISVKMVQPPLSTNEIVRLDETSLEKIESIKISRSTSKYLYNQIVYKYGYNPNVDKFRKGAIFINETSANRIKIGKKQLTITSLGLEDNLSTTNLITRQQQRLFDRYRFAAQTIKAVKPLYDIGYTIEIGDVVVFGSDNLQLTDLSTGERIFKSRLVEVLNKSVDVTSGAVTLELMESSYDINARFGVVSPSSVVNTGSTTTDINLSLSFNSVGEGYEFETEKWVEFIGESIRVHSSDYSFDETSTIKQIKGTNKNVLVLEPALSAAPNAGFILEIPTYVDTGDDLYKDIFVYFNPQVQVTSGISGTQFTCDPSLLFEEAYVYITSDNFSSGDSFPLDDVQIDSIVGTTITLNKDIGFTPQAGDNLELIGFSTDLGNPYRLV